MQTVAVILIVLLACIFVGRKLFSVFRAGGSCGGCSGCASGSCGADKEKKEEKQ